MFTMSEWPEVEHLKVSDDYLEQVLKVMSKDQFDRYVIGRWEGTE